IGADAQMPRAAQLAGGERGAEGGRGEQDHGERLRRVHAPGTGDAPIRPGRVRAVRYLSGGHRAAATSLRRIAAAEDQGLAALGGALWSASNTWRSSHSPSPA